MATRHYKGFRLIGDRQGDGSIVMVRVQLRDVDHGLHFATLDAAKKAIDGVTTGVQYITVPKPKKPKKLRYRPKIAKVVNTHRRIEL